MGDLRFVFGPQFEGVSERGFGASDLGDRPVEAALGCGHEDADSIFGGKPWIVSHTPIATAVFTTPEIGTIGISEQEALAAGYQLRIFDTQFRAMRATMTGREDRTYMKLVVDAGTDRVLGAHMLGPDAGEIIQSLGVAITMGATKADFDRTMALHPSAAEEFVTMRTPRKG
jgi:glutathione reductase (NADPH)